MAQAQRTRPVLKATKDGQALDAVAWIETSLVVNE